MNEQQVAAPPSPYKGLAPFEDSSVDALFFFGRERESEIVAANLLAYRLTVLYGASGVGKSSLLRAGVAHGLRQKGEAVVVFSSWGGDPVSSLLAEVRETLGSDAPAGGLAAALASSTAVLGRELYLILDQFDEYFLYHENDDEFARELAEVTTRPDLRVNVLISIRDDMLSRLDRFKALIPNLLSNYLRLDHLDRRAAREAIVGPLDRYNTLVPGEARVTADPELVEAVLDQTVAGRVEAGEPLDRTRVEAPYLQLVMQRLWEEERKRGSRTLALEILEGLGGAEEIVRAHLGEALESLSAGDRDLVAELFNHLVTPSGTKIAHGIGDLAQYASVSENELAPVLAALVDERIVRPVTAPGQPDGSRYEIFHDVLAEPVVAWRSRHEAERELERTREQARRRHRRLLVVTIVSLIAVVSMVLVTLFALAQRRDARKQAAEAKRAARAALVGELTARASLQLATEPQRSLRLAVRAARFGASDEIEDVLRLALLRSPHAIVRLGMGPANNVDFGRSGLGIAGNEDGTAALFTRDGKIVRTLRHGAPVDVALLSADGRLAVTAGGTRTDLWDPRTGKRLHTLSHRKAVDDAALTRDGRKLATGGVDGEVVVWDTRSGERLHDFSIRSAVKEVRINRDGSLLLVVGADGRAYVYDAPAGSLRTLAVGGRYNPSTQRFEAIEQRVITAAAFAPGGHLAVTASRDGTVFVWTLPTGELHKRFQATGEVLDVEFSPRGSLFVTASADGTAIVWNAGGSRVAVLPGHTNKVTHGSFSPDGTAVVTSSTDGTARLWKAKTGHPLLVFAGHREPVNDAEFSLPNGRIVGTAGADGTLRLWNAEPQPSLAPAGREGGPITAIAVGPGGRTFVAGTVGGRASVWIRGTAVSTVRAAGPVLAAAFASRPVVLASGPRGSTLWNVAARRIVRTFQHDRGATAGALTADARLFATARDDRVRLWGRTGPPLHTLRAPGTVTALALSPNGRRLATAGEDGSAITWDVATGDRLSRCAAGKKLLTSVAFDSSGARLLASSNDSSVHLCDARTGRPQGELPWHHGGVSDAAFSADGRWVATAGPVVAGLGRPAPGPALFLLPGHRSRLTSVAWSPTGYRIVTGYEDGVLRTYNCRLCGGVPQLLAIADERLRLLSSR